MGLPMQLPNEVVPTCESKPKDRLIPSDAILCKRFKAIKDPYVQKLLYACVAFGRRNREIYSMDYDNIQKKDGITMMYVYSNKTKSNGITWCLPFGDEQVDLSGFEPPEWETLKTIDREADESLESMYAHSQQRSPNYARTAWVVTPMTFATAGVARHLSMETMSST